MTGHSFYTSDKWLKFRQQYIMSHLDENGYVIDEITKKPIYKKYDIILHHKIELDETNYDDANISLNPDNIMIVSHKTHNQIHTQLGTYKKRRKNYLVYGPPLCGKTTFVNDNMVSGDILVDIDKIWECLTGCDHVDNKPDGIKQIIFDIRDLIYDDLRHKVGKYNNCYVMGCFKLEAQRERLANDLNAEVIYINTTKDECLARANQLNNKKYIDYIEDWFDLNPPPIER